ncbi:MAG: hypothetical protein RL320_1640 [Pseudomonadota bacterium]|jgi:hypothetical protein
MWTNLLALIVNLVLLVLTLASRMALHGGSLELALSSLPWPSFGTELGEILWAETVSAAALTAGWISLTGLWLVVTLAQWGLSRSRSRQTPSYPKRPEPAFVAATPLPPETNETPPVTPRPAEPSDFDELSRKAARVSPEAHQELERLQAALRLLQKT